MCKNVSPECGHFCFECILGPWIFEGVQDEKESSLDGTW